MKVKYFFAAAFLVFRTRNYFKALYSFQTIQRTEHIAVHIPSEQSAELTVYVRRLPLDCIAKIRRFLRNVVKPVTIICLLIVRHNVVIDFVAVND